MPVKPPRRLPPLVTASIFFVLALVLNIMVNAQDKPAPPAPPASKPKATAQVDGGPIIATPAAKLSFHGLSPGKHQILVMLAANDHSPLGPQQIEPNLTAETKI
jgi:hypothetical protein